MAEKKASQIVNEACLVDCEAGGNVNLTIQGNVTIIAGGDSNVADTEMGKTVASAHGSKDEIRQSQESVDMQSDLRAEGRVRSDKSGRQTKEFEKYLAQGARPKQRKTFSKSNARVTEINSALSVAADEQAELCNVVNAETVRMTKVSVTENFGKDRLTEPDFEIYPQMRKVENFFRGGYEEYEDVKTTVKIRGFFRRSKKKIIKNQMRREMGFHYQNRDNNDETITIEELVTSFSQKKNRPLEETNRVTAIVASAGAGKTTVLRRIAQKCVESNTFGEQRVGRGNKSTGETNFKMRRYMEMKNMKYSADTDVSTFLFDGLYKNKEDEKKAYEWLLEHQSETILYFDGLDQATWSIPTSNQAKMTPFQRANTAEIMYNILSRNLLPQLKIVITSREFKVSELPAKARPAEIINFVGLRQADAEKLFVCLVGERGAELWGKIQTMARRLVNLISIPVFLVLTATLTALDPDRPPPVTITELYSRIMLNLSQVENIEERDQIQIVIKKLKAMAHQGMVEGRVVFTKDDLKKYELSMQDVRDLMIKVPGNKLLSRYLVEGDYIFFFCHQSLQEFLSASFIVEMSWFDFFNFSRKHLHKGRWSVVCAFVSGIIHDKSEEISHKASEMKRRIFRQQIRPRCREEDSDVELLAAIYESNSDGLIQSLPRLPRVSDTSLGPDEAHMFSSILARRGNEKKEEGVGLYRCRLDDELLDIMVQNLKDRKIRVGDLNLIWNERLTAEGLKPFLAIFKADVIKIDFELLKYFRYEDFEWNNITKIEWGLFDVSMTNKGERIEIGGGVNGYFDKTTRALETHLQSPSVFHVQSPINQAALSTFFHQKAPPVAFEYQTHVRADDLSDMKILNVDWKIPKMLLNCRGKKNVDSSLIEFCVEKFQVSFLDLVVDEKTSFAPSNFLTEIESHIGINVNVHWWFRVYHSYDVTMLIPIVQQNQVENLRLCIGWKHSSFDDMKRVIENCKVKKLTLVYRSESEKSRMQHDKIVKIGEQHSIEVDGVIYDGEEGTAWWHLDRWA